MIFKIFLSMKLCALLEGDYAKHASIIAQVLLQRFKLFLRRSPSFYVLCLSHNFFLI